MISFEFVFLKDPCDHTTEIFIFYHILIYQSEIKPKCR